MQQCVAVTPTGSVSGLVTITQFYRRRIQIQLDVTSEE